MKEKAESITNSGAAYKILVGCVCTLYTTHVTLSLMITVGDVTGEFNIARQGGGQ